MCRPGLLVHRHRLSGQQRLIGLNLGPLKQQRIGSNAVALGQYQDIATHHRTAGNAHGQTIAQHQGPRTAQVTQAGQCMLGLALLVQGQGQHHKNQAKQHQPLMQIAKQQVQHARAQQQRKHRVRERFAQDTQPALALLAGELVGPLLAQTLGRLFGSPAHGRRITRTLRLLHFLHHFYL
ncbi:hypothetical protein GALL_510230 [mine drainage metagenome]|uniref:Uncharacterized protein n=1 Tax=mine drainage metagenome TaxID=410659 RepID=A0A1J5P827_9ZZZZ